MDSAIASRESRALDLSDTRMAAPIPADKLQRLDRWAFVPVCAVLSWTRKFFGSVQPRERAEPPRKILFVKFAEMGSTVLAHGAIKRAVEMVGRENVFFLVFKENRFILDALNLTPPENAITISHDSLAEMIADSWAALLRIRRLGIDSAIDMEFFSRASASFTFLTGAKQRVGFHTFFGEGPYRGDLMTHRLLYNPYLHTSQIFLLMVEAFTQSPRTLPTFGIQPPETHDTLPMFAAQPEEIAKVEELVRRENGGIKPGALILLNPNASDLLPLRKWPTENYVSLAKALLERFPEASVGMTGAPEEAETIAQVAREVGSPRCFSFAGKTTLRQLMVLYGVSDLLVTNDSGPAHFAAMTPINVITLFGPETPSLFAAQTPRNTAISLGIACSPCVNAYNNRQSPCTNNVCMKGIMVAMVFAEAERMLQARLKARVASAGEPGQTARA